jgi:hypothetical protein
MRRAALPTLLAVLVTLTGCPGEPVPEPSQSPLGSPPAPIPSFASDPPQLGECFPRSARTQGMPGLIPVPPTARLQGPEEYAGPYQPIGTPARRIAGRGFEFEASSRVALVAGFYAACLDAFATEIEWRRHPAEQDDVLFTIPLQGRPRPVVVLIAANPSGPTAVVTFVDYRVTPAPRPDPSPSQTPESPGPTASV